MGENLVEKAKRIRTRKINVLQDRELAQLAIAYFNGEVTAFQAGGALHTSPANVPNRLSVALRRAIVQGLIKRIEFTEGE